MKIDYKSISGFIGVGYLIIGVLVIAYKKFFIPLEDNISWLLGLVLIFYGIVRIYRAVEYIRKGK